MSDKNLGFGTLAIHSGKTKDAFGSLVAPIYQTSTFEFDNCEQGGRRFAGEEGGYIYTRLGNPTITPLENKIATLEEGEACAATSSGMGAITAALWSILKSGAHIVADSTLYGCTFAYLSHGLTRYGVEVTFVDTTDLSQLKAALQKNTAAVYIETPANPNLKIIDIEAVSKISHEYNPDIMVVCDNTFATPYLQKPLKLGADVVVHSATKYLNGHGDVIAGFVVGKADYINTVKMFGIKDMTGSVLGPQDAFLITRGLKTLEIRMQRHCESARKVADYLYNHEKIETIYFPGLPSHKLHDVAKKQMSDFGGMISFIVKGDKETCMKFVNSLKLITIAVSLGDAETLIEHPASMTHSTYTKEELKEVGIEEGLVRLSIGLENVEDIIADLEYALNLI